MPIEVSRHSLTTSIFAAAIMVAPLGCGECTLQNCLDSTTIELQADSWPDGMYLFTVEADGVTGSCSVAQPALGDAQCQGLNELWLHMSAAGAPIRLSFIGTPSTLGLRLEKDGATVVDTVLQTESHSFSVNGPGCGPTCVSNDAELSVSP